MAKTYASLSGAIVQCQDCGECFANAQLLAKHANKLGCLDPEKLGMQIKKRSCGSFWGTPPIDRARND